MSDRRTTILDAAQALFLSKGFSATTISDIRIAAGASTGSIYHAFASKEAIATALVKRAVEGWTAATHAAAKGTDFEALMRATIQGLLLWGGANLEQFRIMDELRAVARRGEGGEELARYLDEGRTVAQRQFEAEVEAGRLRRVDWPVAAGLMLGPAHEMLRLVGEPLSAGAVDVASEILADAAWAALRQR